MSGAGCCRSPAAGTQTPAEAIVILPDLPRFATHLLAASINWNGTTMASKSGGIVVEHRRIWCCGSRLHFASPLLAERFRPITAARCLPFVHFTRRVQSSTDWQLRKSINRMSNVDNLLSFAKVRCCWRVRGALLCKGALPSKVCCCRLQR